MSTMTFWDDSPKAYLKMPHPSLAEALHPVIRGIIAGLKPEKVLDYGSGDGRFLEQLVGKAELYAWDSNPTMREAVRFRLERQLQECYASVADVPVAFFDVVVCSLVLMMIGAASEYDQTVQHLASALVPGGTLIAAVTHPCFRDRRFSDFQTQFSSGAPFHYFKEGAPFEVRICDPSSDGLITFHDFHYSLSFTFRAFVKAGLTVLDVFEVPDAMGYRDSNSDAPPFLVVVARMQTSGDSHL